MASEFPLTVDEARDHILAIQRRNAIDTSDGNLSNALRLISEDLYQKPAHFLHELIQNADDNAYEPASVPSLSISYSNRALQLSCNELGFSRNNVEALCKIGSSTKSGKAKTGTYTGEKGIGFKSVFKVADVVWIRSGHYSFKFVKSEKLGMLTPIWAEFPTSCDPQHTTIRLELKAEYSEKEVVSELRTLDAHILLFLRQLAKISVSVDAYHHESWSTSISKDAVPFQGSAGAPMRTVTLKKDEEVQVHLVTTYLVQDIPTEPKRPGVCRSNINLAFPVNGYDDGRVLHQMVYASLPIQDFGFKFLLNADFVLSASRETILEFSPWNKALRDALPRAIADALQNLGGTGLRYTWPSFLPIRDKVDDFFGELADPTIGLLKGLPILESMSAELMIPSELTVVPKRFCDSKSMPLVMISDHPSYSRLYLSNGYRKADLPIFLRLGVCEMSDELFLKSLASGIAKSPEEFRAHPDDWHSRLATQLLSILATHPKEIKAVASLPLVPLHDGRWVAAQDNIAVFENTSHDGVGRSSTDMGFGGFDLPEVKTAQVSAAASKDPSRKLLFTTLGIHEEDRPQMVCDQLAEMHDSARFDPRATRPEALIAHVAYMYRSGWTNPSKRNIWVVTTAGYVQRGAQVYVNTGGTHTVRSYLLSYHELHPRYMRVPGDSDSNEKFVAWLVSCCKLSVLPRLVDAPESPSFQLSEDFAYIVQTQRSARVLQLLRDNWDYYSYWIVPSPVPDGLLTGGKTLNRSRRRVLHYLSTLRVLCLNGQFFVLEHTTLPTTALMTELARRRVSLSFEKLVEVPDPDAATWDFLSVFGVRIQNTMRNPQSKVGRQIERLEDLAAKSVKSRMSPEHIAAEAASLYCIIEHCCREELDDLRSIFRRRKLIYYYGQHPNGETWDIWCTSTECQWTGDRALRKTPLLMRLREYADLRDFFTDKLLVASTTDVGSILEEIFKISMIDTVPYITGLYLLLQRSLPSGAEELLDLGVVEKLGERKIFPILRGKGTVGSDFDDLGTMKTDSFWLVADRQHLRRCFEGLVPLLSVSENRFPVIREILRVLGLENRCLSKHVVRKVMGDGDPTFLEGFTVLMRKKVRYIARIIPTENPKRLVVLRGLLHLDVYQVENLEAYWFLNKSNGEVIEGRCERSSGAVYDTDTGGLEILLPRDNSRLSLSIDVVDEIVKRFGQLDMEVTGMLHYILMEHNLASIEDMLDRRGIEDELGENWSTIDMLVDDPRGKCPAHFHQRPSQQESRIRILHELEEDQATRCLLTKRWEGNSTGQMKHLLKQLCLMDHQDPSVFLPTSDLDELLDPGGNEDDEIGTVFHAHLDEVGLRDYPKTSMTIPAVLKISRKNQRQWLIYGPPRNPIDGDMMFFGELYVSKLLQIHLGKAYIPETHWTSSLRTRAGLRPVPSATTYTPAFCINDKSKSLWKFLTKSGLNLPMPESVSHFKFHVDVITTGGDLEGSDFLIHPKHLEHIQKYCLLQEGILDESKVPIIPLLVAVSRANAEPSAVVLVDPFAMYLDGSLDLKFPAHIPGTFKSVKSADHIVLDDSTPAQGVPLHLRTRIKNLVTGSPGLFCTYQYRSLPSYRSIRLLLLQRPEPEKPLRGRMEVVESLDPVPDFVAISYVWGVALKPYRLDTPDGVVWLTASCEAALRSAALAESRTSSAVRVWVDAVCIDQSNTHEKVVQVRHMRDIYRAARRVYGWIGEAEQGDGSVLAMRTLAQIRAVAVKEVDSTSPWPVTLPPAPDEWADNGGIPPEGHEVWPAIENLFSRDYFKRSWITQEVVMARELLIDCGTYRMYWETLYDGLKIAIAKTTKLMQTTNKFRSASSIPLQRAEHAVLLGRTRRIYFRKNGGVKFDLLTLLERFSHTEASLDRDKIFALVGLAKDADDDIFDPDYSSPLETVVRRYASEFVRRDGVLQLLYRAGMTKGYAFSTWIPCWTGRSRRRTISTWRSTKGRFSASGDTGLFATVDSAELGTLQIMATAVDAVSHVGETSLAKNDIWTVLNEIVRSIQGLKSYPTGETIADVQARLPIGDAARSYLEKMNDLLPTPEEDMEAYSALVGVNNAGATTDGDPDWTPTASATALLMPSMHSLLSLLRDPDQDCAVMWKYWHTASTFSLRLGHARFAVTSRGYAGLVPPETQPGDVITIVHGAAVPFVTRKEEGTGVSKLVGECYIHGIMHGEGLDFAGAEEEKIVLQ
ncbi:hypothetical protein QBC47DRAFT_131160 [Echria macrotheca]|uniref:Heterokaryon incompatibility domain-containing protein n=1 Tax=Echria macrotheca TaxID=438768 RepID=A0AAJ0F621_9PEZI|nr:hypothetical protein QBC47DRAFT_131160 [Echria macrotheca]